MGDVLFREETGSTILDIVIRKPTANAFQAGIGTRVRVIKKHHNAIIFPYGDQKFTVVTLEPEDKKDEEATRFKTSSPTTPRPHFLPGTTPLPLDADDIITCFEQTFGDALYLWASLGTIWTSNPSDYARHGLLTFGAVTDSVNGILAHVRSTPTPEWAFAAAASKQIIPRKSFHTSTSYLMAIPTMLASSYTFLCVFHYKNAIGFARPTFASHACLLLDVGTQEGVGVSSQCSSESEVDHRYQDISPVWDEGNLPRAASEAKKEIDSDSWSLVDRED
ncbi:hypothetical protein PQX77_015795 [Marasmius sp. AFHP31]|nr:hypothetical protein PQX77_015795 [Marasmius sp. AFHP31]